MCWSATSGCPSTTVYELIRRVRGLPHAGCNTPAIALTAYARAEDRQCALQAGFQMHASKPIHPSELLSMIAELAGKIPAS